MSDPRQTPNEGAVRDQFRREAELVDEEHVGEPVEAPEPGAQAPADGSADGDPQGEAPDASEAEEVPEGPGSDPSEDADADGPPTRAEDDPVATLQRERDEYLDLARRTQAEFENWRKRTARDATVAGERARSALAGELLSVIDNLERALASAGEAEEHLAGGVRLVHSELVSVLSRNGIESFDPIGEKFDPALHEALSMRPDEDAGSGIVLDVVEKGYRLNANVLRPARVVVSA